MKNGFRSMSDLGQSRHFDRVPLTSGLPQLADILRVSQASASRAAETSSAWRDSLRVHNEIFIGGNPFLHICIRMSLSVSRVGLPQKWVVLIPINPARG